MIGLRSLRRALPRTIERRQYSSQRNVHIKCLSTSNVNEIDNKNILYIQIAGNFKQQSRTFKISSSLYSEIKEVEVPAFAESITEGDLTWVKAVGDQVQADEVVAEVETDKTTVTINAPFAGVIVELLVEDGSTVSPGIKAFKIKAGEGGAPAEASKAETPKVESVKPATEIPAQPAAPTPTPAVDVKPIPSTPPPSTPLPHSPLKSMPPIAAMHHKLNQAQVKVPPPDYSKEITGTRTTQRVKMPRIRIRTAERLKESQNTNAMLTTFNEIDMGSIMELRKSVGDQFLKKHGFKLGFMSAFLKAAAYALQESPVVNAVIEGHDIVYRDYIDISVAVATAKGLVVPVVRNVESMNYADIEKALIDLGKKAKDGLLAIEDMDGGTFTISNGGVFGSMFGTPIINPPQSAILGMHGIFDRPVAINKQVVVRPMMYIALTYDHRLIDGREAVTFLRKIKQAVEDPRMMLCGL